MSLTHGRRAVPIHATTMLLIKNKALRQGVGVLETANFLMLKLLWKNRNGARVFPGVVYRNYMSLARREHWLSQDIFEIFPEAQHLEITLDHMPGGGIGAPIEELAYMACVTRAVAPKRVFEIGTFRGRTALNFALNSPPDAKIYTMDLPPHGRERGGDATNAADAAIISQSETGADYRGKAVSHKIEQLYGDSTRFDFSPYFNQMDLVFVDGAHHFDAAHSDSENALRMLRPGGIVMWHDFGNYGDYNDVTRAVLSVARGNDVIQIGNTQLALHRKR